MRICNRKKKIYSIRIFGCRSFSAVKCVFFSNHISLNTAMDDTVQLYKEVDIYCIRLELRVNRISFELNIQEKERKCHAGFTNSEYCCTNYRE
jgi:hypothetical protein